MTSFLISEPNSAHSFHRKWGFSVTFFISQPIKLKFGTGIQNCMLILISGWKSGSGDGFGQYDTKPLFYTRFGVFCSGGGNLYPYQTGVCHFDQKSSTQKSESYLKLRPKNPETYLKLRTENPGTRNTRLSVHMRKLTTQIRKSLTSTPHFSFTYFIKRFYYLTFVLWCLCKEFKIFLNHYQFKLWHMQCFPKFYHCG